MSELDQSLPVRRNARVVLINDQNKILLMHVQLPSHSFWCTTGGGIEDDETPAGGARREIREEAGFNNDDIRWHGAIWYGEHVMERNGILTLHKETFFLGRTSKENINTAGMTQEESTVVQKFKWWSLSELQSTNEFIVPPSMIQHLKPVLQGALPKHTINIDLTNTPPKNARNISKD